VFNAVESVASIFRLEEVVVRFSEMLIPLKRHDVTAPENGKTEVLGNYGKTGRIL
jgi:hypothetical protein